jgi:alpha-tubulin suppressor-like RCC1 family protein
VVISMACARAPGPSPAVAHTNATPSLSPEVKVLNPPPDGVVEIALAYERSCARLQSGVVKCWGLGFDDAAHTWPTAVAGITEASEIAVGPTHACARLRNGRLRCWGSNELGALGDGTREATPLGATDPGLDNVTEVAVGTHFTCARLASKGASRDVACWGDNHRGTLALGLVHDGELRPTPAPMLSHVQALALSGRHAFAIASDGSVLGWGDGAGLFAGPKPAPFKLPTLGKVREIASSQSHACALLEGGSVVCFGSNDDGQLGDGTTNAHDGLVVAVGIYDAVQIAVADRTSCARHATGAVSCWGANELGQLGDGTTSSRSKAARVPGLMHATSIAVGGSHACALIDDGSMQCWGSNHSGELGDRTRTSRSIRGPVLF